MDEKTEKNDYYWKLLQIQVQEIKLCAVFRLLRENNIEPVLIKGWAAAQSYPQSYERLAVDIDLAVNPNEFEKCAAILKEKNVAGIDLHRGLRHLDTRSWGDLFAETVLLKAGDSEIRVLSAEDHLRVLCVHWLTDGGANKEKLWDIFYAVKNRPDHFDWDKCLGVVSKKRRKWVICTIGLAAKYLGLDLTGIPFQKEANNLPVWLIKTVEDEWKSKIKLKPLESCLYDKKEFWQQLKIRFAANPIQATVLMDGEFDDGSRIIYRLESNLKRIKPSVKRIFETFRRDWRQQRWRK